MFGKIKIKKSKRYELMFGNDGKGFIKEFLTKLGHLVLDYWSKVSRSSKYWRLGRHKPNSPRAIPSKITVRTSRLIQQLHGKGGEFSSGEGYRRIEIKGTGFVYILGFRVPYSRKIFKMYQLFEKSVVLVNQRLQRFANQALKETLK